MVIASTFDYERPDTLEEAVRILSNHSGSVQILAGGTDLVAWMRDDAIAPDLVVDIKDIPGMGEITMGDGTLRIGALTTFTEIIESKIINEHAPLFAEMAVTVASGGIRNRATVVGNICSAVPSCDAGPVLLAYDAFVHVVGPSGARRIDIKDWFVGLRETALMDGEVVTHLTIDLQPHGGVFVKLMRYSGEDLAQASVGIVVLEGDEYAVAFGAVAPTPIRSARIEESLRGKPLDDAVVAAAVAMVRDEISPISDMRASAEYRTHMTEVMLGRGLVAATERLDGSGPPYGTRLI